MKHVPVMLDEVMHYLSPKPEGRYIDCTFGAGGYSRKILSHAANVIAIDQDPDAKKVANDFEREFGDQFSFVQGNFADIRDLVTGKVDGIVWDLGVSSMQLDEGNRGFSFAKPAQLDMRMSQKGYSAMDFVNSASEKEIADVIFHNGGEVKAKQIAKQIVASRKESPITTTTQLADIVRKTVNRYHTKIDSATKTFQAIRIFINDELGALKKSLASAANLLKTGGKIVLVSFHSLEDKIIKDYLKANSAKKVAKSKYAKVDNSSSDAIYQLLTHKSVKPSDEEVKNNPRARSAKLRAAQKIALL
ncbi:hypothetical protein phytr_5800 [Candidatus Phycorickettsia trachydisci]|uniref:Ribosomal RNA small subunit methyltransferase H n=1 Tax=Candidatus Phycorickettsia trachydisci TaxID=2115978 RepID=A0A2P1P8D5_9RICK|nr:16S rRNA (cytosine(1402)-N(4))-methyltransferase RsmH [Candidatus Phycorickettsia trachydisci]AVP87523.1 hypothetical protein phytr_5800 [Candidatus Phycorickettsia trachydisci]